MTLAASKIGRMEGFMGIAKSAQKKLVLNYSLTRGKKTSEARSRSAKTSDPESSTYIL